ncbi:MAG: L-seryl-tRNA(Sec) selenium transferase [Planctomycetes bacterium]|nr:L-seryl-tRNA(Sec) selenium transferase [Planctomycetota bacterium]
MPNSVLRNVPSVNDLLERPPLRRLRDNLSHSVVVGGVRTFLDNLRREVQTAAAERKMPEVGDLAERIAQWILRQEESPLRPAVNATGVLLHTGLGRAPLADDALAAISAVAGGYATVEVDVVTGERSQRSRAVEKLLEQLTGAEAALVVNNNAGATLLTLAALAAGKEVIVSRGQLIEIGGSYRLPDVMTAGGVRLREVGTTNKTRLSDFLSAIGDETAALMRVHTSNYVVVGFAEQPELAELVELAHAHDLPLIDDIGSGALIDYSQFGLTGEPVARDSIKAGADVVLFSGDKLLGGPQCGVIAGRRELVEKIQHHPLARALRVDKITLAALAATLRLYRDPEKAAQEVPLLSLLSTSLENLRNRAQRIASQAAASPAIESAEVIDERTFLGGGSVPTQEIDTVCVALAPAGRSVDSLAAELRGGQPSVFGRIQKDRLLLDLRSVLPAQDRVLVEALQHVGAG